jgi:hypothetical protein
MWGTVAAHLIPAAVSLYGLVVLVTGRAGGFGTRVVEGSRVRVIGVILVAALPLAIAFGLLPRTPNFDGLAREAEIDRDILAEYHDLETWEKQNDPKGKGETKTVPQIDIRLDELEAFRTEYRKRLMEKEARVRELEAEQKTLREAFEADQRQRRQRQGAMWIGIGILLLAWAAVWLVGRKPADDTGRA